MCLNRTQVLFFGLRYKSVMLNDLQKSESGDQGHSKQEEQKRDNLQPGIDAVSKRSRILFVLFCHDCYLRKMVVTLPASGSFIPTSFLARR